MTHTIMHIDALMEKIEKLEAENALLQEQLRLTQVDNNILMTENARYREALEFCSLENVSQRESIFHAREALKGE